MGVTTMTAMGSGASTGLSTTSKTVLVVDDSDFIRRLVSLILRMEGYRVIESNNGKDALKRLREVFIDMMVTDLNMPEMDGIELVRTMRSKSAFAHIPVVMLTSEFLETRKQMAFEAGINEWVPKPFITKHLRNLIRKYVQQESFRKASETRKEICVFDSQ